MALGWLLQFLKLKMIPWRKRIWLWGRIGTVKQLAAKAHSRWEEPAGLLKILPCSALWLWLQFKNKAKFLVWLAVSNTEQVLQDKKGHTHFSGMKICLIPLNTFFVVILHKYSWEVLFSFPCPQGKNKSNTFIAVRSLTADDRAECTWTTQFIVMMIDLCSPREGLLHYSSHKFVGCWTFCEAPLHDPGNVH